MKRILSRIMEEFRTWELPELAYRDAFFPIVKGKATVITGMRRTGKTSLCYQKMKELLAGGVPRDRILHLNFDDDRLMRFTADDFQTILDVYYSEFPQNRDFLCYFFLDEIQNVPGWEHFVRRLIDREKVQVILTGSSSKLLSNEIATSMRGRSVRGVVYPFSFAEFLLADGVFETPPTRLSDRDISLLRNALRRYFTIGGFPEVQSVDERTRHAILQEYIDLVIIDDVVERHEVSNVQVLRHLLDTVLNNPSQKFSVSNFHKEMKDQLKLKCSLSDLYDFLKYLEDAYILFRLKLHSRSVKKAQVNPAKVYPIDMGLVRAVSRDPDANRGHLLENMAFLQMLREGWKMGYVVTEKGGHEVDFYATHPIDKRKRLVQVSYEMPSTETLKREVEALTQAGEELGVDERLIVTWDDEGELDGGISVVPAWRFLLGLQ
ncbi:MAG: ATP-binding protein [Victivallales bacterium]|nr:ATP-binding protein [Victivallales bacterium]